MNSALKSITLLLTTLLVLSSLTHAQQWELVWSDEFEGTSLDLNKWSYQEGTGTEYGLTGWGNNELQYYTDRESNVFVDDGKLHIVARQESFGGMNYTSGRIRTINKGDWKYGRFEIRAKLPKGQGLWPAIWMLPTESVYGVWAASGEIDIMELLGHEPDIIHGTIHYGGTWPENTHTGTTYQLDEGDFSDDFHTFALEWGEGEMRWYVDDVHYQTLTSWHSNGNPFPAPFDQEFHLLLNVAVGGNWPGSPNQSTEFPQEMVVDYVRVYEGELAEVSPPDDGDYGDVVLPLDFEDDSMDWAEIFTGFDGGSIEVVENPDASGINESDMVGKVVKDGGAFWAGVYFDIKTPFTFSNDKHTISMDVWSPRFNVPVLVKVENEFGDEYEIAVNTNSNNEWEEMEWDMSGAGFDTEWSRIVLIFDFAEGQVGDGSSNFTWYFDNLDAEAEFRTVSANLELSDIPGNVYLHQNYPNPFNPTTVINYDLPVAGDVSLDVFDMIGRRVANLVNGRQSAGNHQVHFHASQLSAGMYVYRLHMGDFIQTRKMLLVK